MTLEQLQDKLQSSLEHFVNLGNVLKSSYPTLYPSEQGMMIYSLLIAGRRLATLMKEAQWWQERFIPDVTGIELIEARKDLLGVMEYLARCNCDMEISYQSKIDAEPIFDYDEIIYEENLAQFYPPKEQGIDYTKARKLMIKTSTDNFSDLEIAIKDVNNRIDTLLDDAKNLKRNKSSRMERYNTMRDFYMKHHWQQDKKILIVRAEGELRDEDNKDKSEIVILHNLLQDILADNTLGNNNRTLGGINLHRSNEEDVASMIIDYRDKLNVDDMFAHFRFIESEKLLVNHMDTKTLMFNCCEYQGKLFTNNAAYEFTKIIKRAIIKYVGFEKKKNASLLYSALKDLGLVLVDEGNATLMSEFLHKEYGVIVSDSTITLPLRSCEGRAFCMLDDDNRRKFTAKEFARLKETYWLCYSIINKVLAIDKVGCAEYLKVLHPLVGSVDVFEELEEDQKKRLYYLSSALRGDTLMF